MNLNQYFVYLYLYGICLFYFKCIILLLFLNHTKMKLFTLFKIIMSIFQLKKIDVQFDIYCLHFFITKF